MSKPTAAIRSDVQDLGYKRRPLTFQEQERKEAILASAGMLMAKYGFAAITFTVLADALDFPKGAIKRHFTSPLDILETILRDHLNFIALSMGRTPWSHPERQKRHRAAYHEAAHQPNGLFRDAHKLLIRELDRLPDEARDRLGGIWVSLTEALVPEHLLPVVVGMLNTAGTTIEVIEDMLACYVAAHGEVPAPRPSPAPIPAPINAPVQSEEPAPEAATSAAKAEPGPARWRPSEELARDEELADKPGCWFRTIPSIILPDGSPHHRPRAGPP